MGCGISSQSATMLLLLCRAILGETQKANIGALNLLHWLGACDANTHPFQDSRSDRLFRSGQQIFDFCIKLQHFARCQMRSTMIHTHSNLIERQEAFPPSLSIQNRCAYEIKRHSCRTSWRLYRILTRIQWKRKSRDETGTRRVKLAERTPRLIHGHERRLETRDCGQKAT